MDSHISGIQGPPLSFTAIGSTCMGLWLGGGGIDVSWCGWGCLACTAMKAAELKGASLSSEQEPLWRRLLTQTLHNLTHSIFRTSQPLPPKFQCILYIIHPKHGFWPLIWSRIAGSHKQRLHSNFKCPDVTCLLLYRPSISHTPFLPSESSKTSRNHF